MTPTQPSVPGDRLPPPLPDPCLGALLEAESEAEILREIARLIQETTPVVQTIVRLKTRGARRETQHAEDLYLTVVVKLTERLRRFRAEPHSQPIESFRGLAASATYRAWADLLRSEAPSWANLKRELRRLLAGDSGPAGVALWSTDRGAWLVGRTSWKEGSPPSSTPECRQLLESPEAFLATHPDTDARQLDHGALVSRLLDWAGCPIEFDRMVNLVARLHGIPGRAEVELEEARELPARQPEVPELVAQLEQLRQIWAEVQLLPPRQCAALLLNLKDGDLGLLVYRNIASIREMAAAKQLPVEQLDALWYRLPLADREVADLLQAEVRQVINLRKVARERLARRLQRSQFYED